MVPLTNLFMTLPTKALCNTDQRPLHNKMFMNFLHGVIKRYLEGLMYFLIIFFLFINVKEIQVNLILEFLSPVRHVLKSP